MLSSSIASLLSLSAQSSAVQAGQATRVQVITFSESPGGNGWHYGTQIEATNTGYAGTVVPAEEVKSESTLLDEQIRSVLDQLQAGLDSAAETLHEAWRGAVESGALDADPDAEFGTMLQHLFEDETQLPDDLRAMVETYQKADLSLKDLRDKGMDMLLAVRERESQENMAQFRSALIQAVQDLATAQLAGESTGAAGQLDQGARNALTLIHAARVARGETSAPSPAGGELMQDVRTMALMARHREIVDGIWDRIEDGTLLVSGTTATYWGRPDVTLDVAGGHGAIGYASTVEVMGGASVSASLSSGFSVTA